MDESERLRRNREWPSLVEARRREQKASEDAIGITLSVGEVGRLAALAKKLKGQHRCYAATVEHESCDAARESAWCGRELTRILEGARKL